MNDLPAPADLDASVAELLEMLTAPDPDVRDAHAYEALVGWIRAGVLDDRLRGVGDVSADRLADPRVQARTFAALVVAAAVDRDRTEDLLDDATVRRWLDAFTAWWPAEQDLRGWDESLGWLHAIAHGADLAGALGASPRVARPDLITLLDLVGRRVTAPTDYRYVQMEEDRVARALVRLLARPELTELDATGWLHHVDELFARGGPGPLPIPVANTLAVLRALYVMADRRALPRRTAITDATAKRLNTAFGAYPARREDRTGLD